MKNLGKSVLACSVPLLLLCGCKEVKDRAVARVAGKPITIGDFNFLAQKLSGGNAEKARDSLAVIRRFLDLFIDRELLLVEGEARHLDQDEGIANELRQFQEELLVQAVYDQEVFARKIAVSAPEVADLYREWGSGEEIRASHILCPTEEEANRILEELKRGESFEALAQKVSTHLGSAIAGGDMGYMRKGFLLSEFRDQVWGLGVGEIYPQPLKSRLGFHLVKVTARRILPLDSLQTELHQEVERRKREARKAAYAAALRKRYRFKWHDEVACLLAERGLAMAGDSTTVLAEWTGGRLTVAEYVRRIHRYGVKRTLADTARAREKGEKVTLDDLLAAEGRRKGFDRDRELVRALEDRRAKLLAEKLFAVEVEDKVPVTDESIRSFYEAHRENYRMPPSVSLQEILVDDQETADSLKSLILAGADLADLAGHYTKRSWAREHGGRVGPLTERTLGYGPLFRLALKAEMGVLQGPVPLSDGFSLFKVLERSEERPATFDEAKETVQTDMFERAMDRFIESLRTKYASQTVIDEKVLQSVLH